MESDNENVTEFFWDAGKTRDLIDAQTRRYSRSFALKSDPSVKFALFMDGNEQCSNTLDKGIIVKNIDENKPVRVKIQLWIFDPDDEKLYEHVSENFTFSRRNQKCEFGTAYAEESFLLNVHDENLGITFGCELTHLNPGPYPRLPKFKDYLVENLQDLYEDDSDTIIVAGGKEFKVLRGVLILHSSVFRRMFLGDFKEASTGKVEVNDASAAAMEEFIKWMYTGEVTNMNVIEELFVIADKYMIEILKSLCANLIFGTLTEENAARRLVLAAKHNDKELKQQVFKFISEKGSDFAFKVMESKIWVEYMKLQRGDEN